MYDISLDGLVENGYAQAHMPDKVCMMSVTGSGFKVLLNRKRTRGFYVYQLLWDHGLLLHLSCVAKHSMLGAREDQL